MGSSGFSSGIGVLSRLAHPGTGLADTIQIGVIPSLRKGVGLPERLDNVVRMKEENIGMLAVTLRLDLDEAQLHEHLHPLTPCADCPAPNIPSSEGMVSLVLDLHETLIEGPVPKLKVDTRGVAAPLGDISLISVMTRERVLGIEQNP